MRDQLYQLYLGRPHGGKLNLTLTSELPGNVLSLSLDPENVTLEAEHFADADRERFASASRCSGSGRCSTARPSASITGWALRFRCMLGRHIFEHMGAGVKIYHGVDLTYGYNLSIGDGVTIRQRALLNDRGGITIGKNAVIGSFARIYSHTHAAENYDQVTLVPTVIGAGARIASHAIVLAGQNVAAGRSGGQLPGRPSVEARPSGRPLHANLSFPARGECVCNPVAFIIAVFEFVLLLFSLSVHECAHAWMASRLGDQTARLQGRVTLNPMYHVDPIGTLLFPALMIFGPFIGFGFLGGFLVGWAKPTPVISRNFRNFVRDDMLVTLAGPASNLLLALVAFLVLAVVSIAVPDGRQLVAGVILRRHLGHGRAIACRRWCCCARWPS